MPLADGAEADAPYRARFRLTREPAGWMLWRDGDPATTDGRGTEPGWQRQYDLTDEAACDADCVLGCHWSAMAPASRFVRHAIVSLVLPHGFASLTDRSYRRRAGSDSAAATIDDPRVYRLRLSMIFGIDLAADEVAALGLF